MCGNAQILSYPYINTNFFCNNFVFNDLNFHSKANSYTCIYMKWLNYFGFSIIFEKGTV